MMKAVFLCALFPFDQIQESLPSNQSLTPVWYSKAKNFFRITVRDGIDQLPGMAL